MEHSLRIRNIGSVVAIIALVVLLTTCGGGGKPTPPEGSSPGITIDPTGGLLTSECNSRLLPLFSLLIPTRLILYCTFK